MFWTRVGLLLTPLHANDADATHSHGVLVRVNHMNDSKDYRQWIAEHTAPWAATTLCFCVAAEAFVVVVSTREQQQTKQGKEQNPPFGLLQFKRTTLCSCKVG